MVIHLDKLKEEDVDELLHLHAKALPVTVLSSGYKELRRAIERYDGHPYAVKAAIDLVADGWPVDKLPADPTWEKIANAQWKKVCRDHGPMAIKLFQAWAILEVAVPLEVVQAVSQCEPEDQMALMAHPYIDGLVREEADGYRIYHALLADYIRGHWGRMGEKERRAYHKRAMAVYRDRLNAKNVPDKLAAQRLPLHVLAATGDTEAFVDCLLGECARSMMMLGLLDSLIVLCQTALERVDQNSSMWAGIISCLGETYRRRGDLDNAEEMIHKAVEFYEKLPGGREALSAQYGNLGLIYATRGDLGRAEAFHQKAAEIHEHLRSPERDADLINLGRTYEVRGELTIAASMYLLIFE